MLYIFLNFLEELENFIEKHNHRIKMNIESNPEIYGCNFLTNINDTHNLLKNKKLMDTLNNQNVNTSNIEEKIRETQQNAKAFNSILLFSY